VEVFKRIKFLKLFRFSRQVGVIASEAVCNTNSAEDGRSTCLNEILQHRSYVILFEKIVHTKHSDTDHVRYRGAVQCSDLQRDGVSA
jgi:hypothetical protein